MVGRELAQALLFTSQRVQPAALTTAGFAFSDPELPAALATIL